MALQENLKRLADEVRLKIHLASKDAQDKWAELQPKVREFERRAEQETDKVAEDLKKVGHELHGELQKLVDRVKVSK